MLKALVKYGRKQTFQEFFFLHRVYSVGYGLVFVKFISLCFCKIFQFANTVRRKRQKILRLLHRVRAVTPEGLILWGDNQYRLEYGVQNAQIIGYAARIFRDDREVDIDGLVYRLWLWLWQYRPMRRVLLPIVYHLRKVKFYAEN